MKRLFDIYRDALLRRDVTDWLLLGVTVFVLAGLVWSTVLFRSIIFSMPTLVIVAAIGAGLIFARNWRSQRISNTNEQHLAVDSDTSEADESELEQTKEFSEPLIGDVHDDHDETTPLKPGRRMVTDNEGNTYLVVNQRNKYRPPRPSRFGKRPKPITKWATYRLLVMQNKLTNKKLVRKSTFEPLPGENVISMYRQLHWWSHGPQQIGVIALAIVATIGLFVFTAFKHTANVELASVAVWVVVMFILAIMYAVVWIPWAYHLLIVTNVRVILVYQPPLALEGDWNSLMISDIISVRTVDQAVSKHSKYLPVWGNVLPKYFHITGYKILKGDSAAQDDDWFSNGIYYVSDAEEVEKLITTIRAEQKAVQTARHEEDMRFQERQALASERAADAGEETRDIMRDWAQNNR